MDKLVDRHKLGKIKDTIIKEVRGSDASIKDRLWALNHLSATIESLEWELKNEQRAG